MTTSYLADSLSVFRYYKRLAEAATADTDEYLFAVLDPEMNSIALAGNLRSRWESGWNSLFFALEHDRARNSTG